MKIAALQMVSTPSVDENLDTADTLIAEAARAGASLVALPEYFCVMGRHDTDKLAVAEAPGDGPIQARLAQAAQRHGVWIIGGTLPLRIEGDAEHATNSSLVWGPDGRQAARYDKLHLFRYHDGDRQYDEAVTLRAGELPCAFDCRVPAVASTDEPARLRVGLSVCYDLRFPELYRALMQPPCDLLAVPAAFTHVTGLAHWELLLRARAVENQCYVIAPAQGGRHPNGRRTFGHSMIVDPWGEVLACRPEGAGVVLAEVDPDRLAAVRRQLPALEHRRSFGSTPMH